MLKRLRVDNFKSFGEIEIELPRLAVFFGPNAVGKSNLIEAIQALSRIGTERTLAEALSDPIRGYPAEMFRFQSGGLAELLSTPTANFSIEADLAVSNVTNTNTKSYRYRIMVEIATQSGRFTNREEFLSPINSAGEPNGPPAIETDKESFVIRRQSRGRPLSKELGDNRAFLSDMKFSSPAHMYIEQVRNELSGWQAYYLEPNSMRNPRPPADVYDIGSNGKSISSFLYKLKSENRKHYDGVVRALRTIIPSIERVDVNLNKNQGTIDLYVNQYGTDYSSRIISEGTLRVLGLCAIAVNPWKGSLLALEEPENGVHPRRIELIAQLLVSLSQVKNQVIVTTHSPIFCNEIIRQARSNPDFDIGLFTFQGGNGETKIRSFPIKGEIFGDTEILEELTNKGEDGLFEGLVMRGFIDE